SLGFGQERRVEEGRRGAGAGRAAVEPGAPADAADQLEQRRSLRAVHARREYAPARDRSRGREPKRRIHGRASKGPSQRGYSLVWSGGNALCTLRQVCKPSSTRMALTPASSLLRPSRFQTMRCFAPCCGAEPAANSPASAPPWVARMFSEE